MWVWGWTSSFYEWFAVMPWRGPVSLSRVGWQRAGCAAQTEFGITSEVAPVLPRANTSCEPQVPRTPPPSRVARVPHEPVRFSSGLEALGLRPLAIVRPVGGRSCGRLMVSSERWCSRVDVRVTDPFLVTNRRRPPIPLPPRHRVTASAIPSWRRRPRSRDRAAVRLARRRRHAIGAHGPLGV